MASSTCTRYTYIHNFIGSLHVRLDIPSISTFLSSANLVNTIVCKNAYISENADLKDCQVAAAFTVEANSMLLYSRYYANVNAFEDTQLFFMCKYAQFV